MFESNLAESWRWPLLCEHSAESIWRVQYVIPKKKKNLPTDGQLRVLSYGLFLTFFFARGCSCKRLTRRKNCRIRKSRVFLIFLCLASALQVETSWSFYLITPQFQSQPRVSLAFLFFSFSCFYFNLKSSHHMDEVHLPLIVTYVFNRSCGLVSDEEAIRMRTLLST